MRAVVRVNDNRFCRLWQKRGSYKQYTSTLATAGTIGGWPWGMYRYGIICGGMALKTMGFLNERQLKRHFGEHGADFGASNAREYEEAADLMLGGDPAPGVQECIRKQGDKLRYDPKTEAYGVLDSRRIIRTYFKPIPCSTVPASARVAMKLAGKCHKYASNLLYFQSECKRW